MRRFSIFMLMFLLLANTSFADQVITITFTGDVTLGCEERLRDKDYAFNGFAKQYGYDYFFSNVKHILASDDLTVVNLEGVLSDSSAQEKTKKTYRFRGRTDYARILTGSSIEAVNLANNHTGDYGTQGKIATKAILDEYAIGYFGNRDVYIYEKNGIQIAFLSVAWTDYVDNKDWFNKKIKALKDNGVNSIIFTFHAGQEYSRSHQLDQINFANFALSAGCDLVVMHHPHVLQGVSIENNRNILWSLGNFCFGGNCEVRELYSAIAQVEMTFSDEGQYLGQQLVIYPAHISGTFPNSNFQPVLVDGSDANYVMSLIQADSNFTLNPYDDRLGYARQDYLPAN